MVQCCPGLTSMQLHTPDSGDDDPDAEPVPWVAHGLPLLAGFPRLQRLSLGWVPLSEADWGNTLAALPSLKDLTVMDERLDTLRGVVAMTACRSLTRLEVAVYSADYGVPLELKVENQAPAGSPPDAWCRLPAAAINTAVEVVRGWPDGPVFDFYCCLTSAATASMSITQAEQQQEVLGLRQRTAALEAAQAEQQQQQTGALQQQMQDMQAAMQRLLQGGRQ